MAAVQFLRPLAASGRQDRAAAELERFLEIFPEDPQGRERLCQTRAAQGEFEAALVECTRLAERLPDYPAPYYTMAYALANLERFDEAVALYRRLQKLEPGATPQILNEIGRIELHRGRHEQAIAVYREAIADSSDGPGTPIPDLRFNYGSALRAAGRDPEAIMAFDEAVNDYRRAIALDPRAIAPRLALVRSLLQLGRSEEAIPELEQLLELDAANPEAHFTLVQTLEGRGSYREAALASLRAARELRAVGRVEDAEAMERNARRLER